MNLKRRQGFEMVWALVCPPLVAILTLVALLAWLDWDGIQSFRHYSQVLMPLNVTGAVLFSAVILLDLRAVEKLCGLTAADVRLALYVSGLTSLAFLAVWVTAQAGRDNTSYTDETIMFICLPMLLVCAPLLWYSARAIRRISLRVWLLVGFVMATIWAESQCQTENLDSSEDRVLMFNSLLVALAVAIRLCVWGATEYRRAEGAGP